MQQAVREQEVFNRHVDDENNWSDFLTKFVSKAKLVRSLKRATNSGQALPLK